jgi:DNA-binding PadR family transcriptional regulator
MFGGHGGPGGRGGGRRSRRRKGDVREALLALLAERPMHGYEMLAELDERTEGVWRPSPGSVYPTLQMLEDEGLVQGEKAEGKRMYALTEAGREHVEQRQGKPKPWDEVTEGISPAALNLRGEIASVAGAAGQVMMVGSHEQQTRALEVLGEARRRLYGILAEDDPSTAGEPTADDPED